MWRGSSMCLAAAALAVAAGCSSGQAEPSGSGGDAGARGLEVLAVVDLPRTAATQGLSGTWFDAPTRTLFAVQDVAPRLVPLVATEDLAGFSVGSPVSLTGRPDGAWDGEAVVRADGVFTVVTVETAPLVERFDATGHYLAPVYVPAIFAAQAANNKGLESLALAPSGAFLFTANESALTPDGAPASQAQGTVVRVLRRELASLHDEAHAYRTEPLGAGTGGDMGVSDLLALSDATLLVLERGYQADFGNTVRIYRVDFTAPGPGAADVLGLPALDAATPAMDKTLVVDIGALPPSGATHPGLQPNPLLDNYEALALGPTLPDGRRVVFVTSDDNASASQVARVLVLAIPGL